MWSASEGWPVPLSLGTSNRFIKSSCWVEVLLIFEDSACAEVVSVADVSTWPCWCEDIELAVIIIVDNRIKLTLAKTIAFLNDLAILDCYAAPSSGIWT